MNSESECNHHQNSIGGIQNDPDKQNKIIDIETSVIYIFFVLILEWKYDKTQVYHRLTYKNCLYWVTQNKEVNRKGYEKKCCTAEN